MELKDVSNEQIEFKELLENGVVLSLNLKKRMKLNLNSMLKLNKKYIMV